MAKNTGRNSRQGSVKERTRGQNQETNGWTKRENAGDGLMMDAKSDGQHLKGEGKESSIADEKMMRAWSAINENRHGAKSKY